MLWLQSTFLDLFHLLFSLSASMEVVTHHIAIGVQVDHQRQLKQVLRFGISGCGSNFLSPVKPPSYLRLKNTYPRRYRLIRQSRGVLAVLSECENEGPWYFYRGHFSWALWPRRAPRPRQKHHLCLQKQISSSFYLSVLCNMGIPFPHWCTMLYRYILKLLL
jgi:hypothetical protein